MYIPINASVHAQRSSHQAAMNLPHTPKPLPSTPMPPLSVYAMDESPPNATKATIALVGQNAQILKLASWQGKLANVVATTQSGISQTYMEADTSIASLWDAVREIRTDLDLRRWPLCG